MSNSARSPWSCTRDIHQSQGPRKQSTRTSCSPQIPAVHRRRCAMENSEGPSAHEFLQQFSKNPLSLTTVIALIYRVSRSNNCSCESWSTCYMGTRLTSGLKWNHNMYARSCSGNGKFTHPSKLDSSLVFVEPDFLGCLASFRVSSLEERAKFLPTFSVRHPKLELFFFLRSGGS